MDLILADKNYLDIKLINHAIIDVDVGETNDFQLVLRRDEYTKDYTKGNIVYVPFTEYGGIIGEIDTDTALDTLTIQGDSWRGLLNKKIIEPASGQDYATASGELNTIIRNLVDNRFSGLIVGSTDDIGVTIDSFQFERYCTLLDGLTKMLKSVGHKLQIQLIQLGLGNPSHVEVSAVPIEDFADEIELSQDSKLNFRFNNIYNGINHLICLGEGDLREREVLHLYVDENGSIGDTQFFTGLEELVEIYDYKSADSIDVLRTEGTKRLQEIMNSQTFEMNVESLNLSVEIGDIIGGRDYLTGIYAKQPVKSKVWRQENGVESIVYKVEGEQA